MGKILLIEPSKILRQAIALSLFPEHEVQVEESISASGVGSLKDYDLLIVDGAALRESDQLAPEITRAIQGSKIPTLWLEGEEPSRPPKREKLFIVKKPIERETFQSTLAGLLSPQSVPKKGTVSLAAVGAEASRPKRAAKKSRAEAPQQTKFQFIDLVDVVEEQPPPKQGRRSPRKPK
ncbi:MAG: hypothetical protein ACE5JO_11420 [Candidatus Binatia bacterium]